MNFANGMLNLTNWLANVIMPTLAGLFAAGAIYRFSKSQPCHQLGWAALASLMCSGLLRALESFSNQAAWNNPDRYWISLLTLVNWVGNVLLPLYGALQVVLAVVHFSGLLERMTGQSTLPVDVWIDGSNRVRRLAMQMSLCSPVGTVSESFQMDLYDYGRQPPVHVPAASEVTDLTSQLSSHTTQALQQLHCS